MTDFYPEYYKDFRCIAADCPDSCCRGWDVVIDSETESLYNTVKGELGEKLRAAIYTDPDGDRVFRLAEDKKCPFWGKDKLCDIYRELGKESLCGTCARFPRISMDYTLFREHSLSLACPEAARLITEADGAYGGFTLYEVGECDEYDSRLMNILLRERKQAAAVLNESIPLKIRLMMIFCANSVLQKKLTGEKSEGEADSCGFIFELYSQLDFIDENHREMLLNSRIDFPDFSGKKPELTRLALYWLYRYYLCAIDTANVMQPTIFMICSLIITSAIAEKYGLTIDRAAQLYSKEIEQSYENTERLWELFDSDPRFSGLAALL